MRKTAIGGILALSLLAPAGALANKVKLVGSVPDTGTIKMTSHHSASTGRYKITNLAISDAAIECGGTAYTFGARATDYVFKVAKDGTFGATLAPTQSQNPPNRLKIAGKLTHHGRRAAGTYSLKGDQVVTYSGYEDSCSTGTVDWIAKEVH